MKKHFCRIYAILLALMCAAVFPVSAVAAERVIASATIPLSVSVSGEEGTLESDIPVETYTFTLTALNDAPMPTNDTVTIEGSGKAEYQISYSTVGIYRYMVSQDVSSLSGEQSSCHDRGNYDDSTFYVTVTVTNVEDGGYGVIVAAHRNNDEEEKEELTFENRYDPVPYESLTVKKTWTDNSSTRPSSINVQLLDGSSVVETVQMSASAGWTYTWDSLDPYGTHSWDVKELAVTGYTASYSKGSDGVITIHNTGASASGDKLIQTGQLNWPIPVLMTLGCALMCGGIFMVTRKKEQKDE